MASRSHRTSLPAQSGAPARTAWRTAYGLVLVVTLAAAGCSSEDTERQPSRPTGVTTTPEPSPTTADPTDTSTPTGNEAAETTEPEPTTEAPEETAIEVVTTGLEVPWGLVVLADGTAIVGERDSAQVWQLPPDGEPQLLGTVPGVVAGGEGGLLGLAVPEEGDGSTLYAYVTAAEDNRVVRLTWADTGAGDSDPQVEVIIDGIPKAGNHNGGRITFGPDGQLYVATGDAAVTSLSQDPDSLAGKILRLTADGEPSEGNPTPGSPVWSLGHRNVQGLDWDAEGRLWASEFGANAWDEVNLIEPGGNYGWPDVEGMGGGDDFVDPVVVWTTAEASPSGLAVGPDGDLYVAALRGQSLWRVPLDPGGVAGDPERLLEGEYGRIRTVVTGPDDALWVLTSNIFRGDPHPDDDRLLRITHPAGLED